MFHSIILHWKAEAIGLAILGFLAALLHEVTGPKVLFVMTVIAEWSDIVSTRVVFSTLFSAAVGWFVWWLQKRVNERRFVEREKNAATLKRQLDYEIREKAMLADGVVELTARVTASEKTIQDFKTSIALMDQTVRPLFEAAKLKLIESLTHPDAEFKVPDELLDALRKPGAVMTSELTKILKDRETSNHPDVTPEEKLAAAILPKIMMLAAAEKTATGPITAQIVSSPIEKL